MKSFLLRLSLASFVLAFMAGNAWAQTQAGTIKALRITGNVTKLSANGTSSRLVDGALLVESDTIVTDLNSGVVLVFMNGSSVKLGAGSRLAIEQFKMDPLTEDIAVAKLTAEPTVSQTTLNLSYGELVGDVKKLNRSSNYSIKTPAGAAGIRGTQFRIVLIPSLDGKTFSFTLSTADGLVVLSGTAPGSADVQVAQGTELVVTAEVDTNTGAVSNIQVVTQGISADASSAITAAVNDVIQQAQADAVFTPEQQKSDAATSDTTTTTPTETTTPQEETPPPETTTPQPIDPSTVSRSG